MTPSAFKRKNIENNKKKSFLKICIQTNKYIYLFKEKKGLLFT